MTIFLYFIIIVVFLDTFVQLPIITPYALDLGASFALTAASIGLVAIIGPVIGGVMAARSKIDVIFISILFLITALLIVKILDESFVSTERGKFNFKDF